MRFLRVWILLAAMAALSVGGWAQVPVRYNLFGGALLGSPSGFAVGGGLDFDINHDITFDPSISVGRSGTDGLFTLDGIFHYEFHPDDEAFIPYLLGGVGLAQWGSATHGSPIGGVGVRFPVGHDLWVVPEVQAATRGLSRFTIGISKTF